MLRLGQAGAFHFRFDPIAQAGRDLDGFDEFTVLDP
jgi:hypothetical protein